MSPKLHEAYLYEEIILYLSEIQIEGRVLYFCFLNMATLLREEKNILFSFLGWV